MHYILYHLEVMALSFALLLGVAVLIGWRLNKHANRGFPDRHW